VGSSAGASVASSTGASVGSGLGPQATTSVLTMTNRLTSDHSIRFFISLSSYVLVLHVLFFESIVLGLQLSYSVLDRITSSTQTPVYGSSMIESCFSVFSC
jgi:hypothetical protein